MSPPLSGTLTPDTFGRLLTARHPMKGGARSGPACTSIGVGLSPQQTERADEPALFGGTGARRVVAVKRKRELDVVVRLAGHQGAMGRRAIAARPGCRGEGRAAPEREQGQDGAALAAHALGAGLGVVPGGQRDRRPDRRVKEGTGRSQPDGNDAPAVRGVALRIADDDGGAWPVGGGRARRCARAQGRGGSCGPDRRATRRGPVTMRGEATSLRPRAVLCPRPVLLALVCWPHARGVRPRRPPLRGRYRVTRRGAIARSVRDARAARGLSPPLAAKFLCRTHVLLYMVQGGGHGGGAGERARCVAEGRRTRERGRMVLSRTRWWQAAQM